MHELNIMIPESGSFVSGDYEYRHVLFNRTAFTTTSKHQINHISDRVLPRHCMAEFLQAKQQQLETK